MRPDGVQELGQDVWSPYGVKVLGTPVGSELFVQNHLDDKLAEEQRLWEALPEIPDLQCAFQVLLQCASPRANHLLRTVPPSQVLTYAKGHDAGMWETFCKLLGGLPGSADEKKTASQLLTLPQRLGGGGLRSATRTSPAAYWSSWADALAMLDARLPTVANLAVVELESQEAGPECLREVQRADRLLERSGFVKKPGWAQLRDGERPPKNETAELGEWSHGWQFYAASVLEHTFRSRVFLTQSSDPSTRAHLRSHSGSNSSAVLSGAPTCPEF